MNATLVRDTLDRMLIDENVALAEFETLLEKEHGALKTRDIDALEALADARQESLLKLLKIEDERRALSSLHGYETDLKGLATMLAWCDPARSLAHRYDECSVRARRCRELNDRNGIMVSAQMKRVEGLLGAITGSRSEPAAYGPRGAKNPYAGNAGRVISMEA